MFKKTAVLLLGLSSMLFANDRLFFYPNLQLSNNTYSTDQGVDKSAAYILGNLSADYFINSAYQCRISGLGTIEKTLRGDALDNSYVYLQGKLFYKPSPKWRADLTAYPSYYHDRVDDFKLVSITVMPSLYYYVTPQAYLKVYYSHANQDYRNLEPKQIKQKIGASYQWPDQGRWSPYLSAYHTFGNESSSTQISLSGSYDIKENQSLSFGLDYGLYESDDERLTTWTPTVGYIYYINNQISFDLFVDYSLQENEGNELLITFGLSYFSSLNKDLKKAHRNIAGLLYEQIDENIKKREYKKAKHALKELLFMDEYNTDAYVQMSYVYYQERQFRRSVSYIQKALLIDPGRYDAIYLLAINELQVQEIKKALERLEFLYEKTKDPQLKLIVNKIKKEEDRE